MKKAAVTFSLSFALLLSVTVFAFADGYPKLDNLTPGQAGYVLAQLLATQTGNYVYNVNCNASSYTYSVTVSYDSLSDICAAANGVGVTCSVYYNSHAEVYVIAVSDRTTLGLTGTYGVIGNPDGYIYTAEKDDSSSAETVNSISDTLMYMRLHVTNIMNRCNDFYTQLEYICDRFDSIGTTLNTGFGKIDQTNSWLQQMIRQLDHIDDSLYDDSFPLISKLDEIKTAIENISVSADGLTVSAYDDAALLGKLDAIKAAIDSVAAGAYDDTSLLGKLTSIDNRLSVIADNSDNSGIVDMLYQIQTSLSNLSLNIDGLENVTIDAYDDSTLLSYLTSGLNYWENIDMGIQSLNSALYYGADSELSQKLRAISTTLASINSRLVTISGYLYKSNGESLLGYLKSISESLAQLGRSGSEVPSTVLDFIIMRIVPTQDVMNNSVGVIKATTNSILTSVDTLSERVLSISDTQTAIYTVLSDMSTKNGKYLSNIYTEVSRIRASVGTGVQGQSLITLLQLVSSSLHNIETKISDLTVSSSYDDTNMIAAVNSVEAALSNLSFSGEVSTDLTPVITSIDAVGVNIEDLNANFNTSLGSLVDKLDVIVDKSSESVENLTVEISVDNDAHNVFYVTDEDGNEESLVDFSGDVLKAGGKLLNFLFKVCFDGAIDNLDGTIDDMDSFYFDGAELGGSLWE